MLAGDYEPGPRKQERNTLNSNREDSGLLPLMPAVKITGFPLAVLGFQTHPLFFFFDAFHVCVFKLDFVTQTIVQ